MKLIKILSMNLSIVLATAMLPGMAAAQQVISFQGLSLQDAERIALERDSLIKSFEQQSGAFVDQSIAVDSWPDPRIKLGAQAVPIDSFDLKQEPMTQIIVGYQQMLPRGDSNQYAAESMLAMSRLQAAKKEQRIREVLRQVRKAWLDVVLQTESIRIIQANRQLFVKMLDISQSYYAAGRQQQQDVVQAELEISLVDDRLQQASSKLIVARANLAKWMGEDNLQGDIDFNGNDLEIITIPAYAELTKRLLEHPELVSAQEKIISQQNKLEIANAQYSPQWGFDVSYGKRSGENMDGSERDDFLTAMVTFDLPVFTENRQDRNVSAEKQNLQASRYQQLDIRRILEKRVQEVSGQLRKLKDRHQLYRNKVLPQAQQNAEVALRGYQSGVVTFFTLTRARITELNTRLAELRIKVDYSKTLAELQYLTGDVK